MVNWASGAQVSYSHFSLFLLQLLIGNWVSFSDFTISSLCAKPCVPLPLAWGCTCQIHKYWEILAPRYYSRGSMGG